MMTGSEKPTMTEQQREAGRHELFSLMRQEHGVTCMESELTDIEQCVLSYALSHAEGEAVAVGYLSVLSDGTRIVDTRRQYDAPEVWPLYTHPAPQVAVPEGFTVVPVREFYVMSEDEDIIGGIGNDLEAGKHLLKLAQEGEPEKAWGLVADIDQTKLAAAPTAPAGEDWMGSQERADLARQLAEYSGATTSSTEQPVSDPDGLPGTPRPMSTAPRDGTMVRLLVQFTNHGVNDGFDSGPAWTIGANTYDDSGDDEWHIAGWNWQQDCFTAGEGEPLGWLPMLSTPAPDEREIAARAIDAMIDQLPWSRYSDDHPDVIEVALMLEHCEHLRAGKEGEQS